MAATNTNGNVRLLSALVDFDEEEDSEYRFVDDKHVKYVTVAPEALPKDNRTFAPTLLSLLPPFPPEDWNQGHVSKNDTTGALIFSGCTNEPLAAIKSVWHNTKIDHLEFTKFDRLRQNIHRVTHPRFDQPVILKFAEFPWQIPYFASETRAYEWIEGTEIGLKFLGHLTEEGRVFGFILEDIDGARTAGPQDLAACQATLVKLHALAIQHGDINKYNFLIARERTVLVDFETAKRCAGTEELASELQNLEQSLGDSSRKGAI